MDGATNTGVDAAVADHSNGASWPDVALALVAWAREEPFWFLLQLFGVAAILLGCFVIVARVSPKITKLGTDELERAFRQNLAKGSETPDLPFWSKE